MQALEEKPRIFPTTMFVFTILITVIAMIWLANNAYKTHMILEETLERDFKIHELRSTITHLDEVLTMSAYMAAVTGDSAWKERYDKHVPILDKALKEEYRLAPETYEAEPAKKTSEANIELIKIETRAFDFIDKEQFEEAQEILFGERYKALKITYANSTDEFVRELKKYSQGRVSEHSRLSYFSTIMTLIVTTLLIFSWIVVARHLKFWRDDLRAMQKRSEEISQRLQAVLDGTHEGFLTMERRGIIESCNNACAEIFGYAPDEMIGRNINEFVPTPYTGGREGYNSAEVEGIHKDGSILPLEASTSEVQIGDQLILSGFVRNIAERKNVEQEREQLINKLTDSNEELERFAYVCSHDMQEPLRMIRSFSEKLQGHLGDQLEGDEKGQRYFRFVIDGATRAQNLIVDILAYSSLDRDTKSQETVVLDEIMLAIKDNLSVNLEEDGGSISSDPLPIVRGNKTQLYQLFQNLINNGLKYQQAGSKPHVHISVKETDVAWQIMVEDNGIGMEDRHVGKIFDVFRRLHRKDEYAGTGIGLSICKKIVERHNGKIWVESEFGIGSRFIFTLLKTIE